MRITPAIIQYLNSLQVFTQPWTVVAVGVSSIIAYFTLLYHLGECLNGPATYLTVHQKAHRTACLCKAKKALMLTGGFGVVTLMILSVRIMMTCKGGTDGVTMCSLVAFFATLFCALNAILLAVEGYVVEDYIFEFKRQEAEMAAVSSDTVVYLRCGNKVRGKFKDLGFLQGKPYFKFILEERKVVTLASEDVAAVFLQRAYGRRKFFGPKMFKEGPKSLRITFPHEEVFLNTSYFKRDNYSILRIAKPTTRSRYAIVDSKFVQEV